MAEEIRIYIKSNIISDINNTTREDIRDELFWLDMMTSKKRKFIWGIFYKPPDQKKRN